MEEVKDEIKQEILKRIQQNPLRIIDLFDFLQEVAVDILEDLEIILMHTKDTVSPDLLFDLIHKKEDEYSLCRDPFTKMLCTSKECEKLEEEYNRQLFEEKFDN